MKKNNFPKRKRIIEISNFTNNYDNKRNIYSLNNRINFFSLNDNYINNII